MNPDMIEPRCAFSPAASKQVYILDWGPGAGTAELAFPIKPITVPDFPQ
jgi:hypothetical protein